MMVLPVLLGVLLDVVLGARALAERLKLETVSLCLEKLSWAPSGGFSY